MKRGEVRPQFHKIACQQPLDLGGEQQPVPLMIVVERLDAQPITCREQLVPARVVNRKGKHPIQASETVVPPLLVSLEHHFGVALGAEGMSKGVELLTNLSVVVDLAVVGNPERPVVVAHGLVTGRREVDYCETAVAEAAASLVEPGKPSIVRTAV